MLFFSDPTDDLKIDPSPGLSLPFGDFSQWLRSNELVRAIAFATEIVAHAVRYHEHKLRRGPTHLTYRSPKELPRVHFRRNSVDSDEDFCFDDDDDEGKGMAAGKARNPNLISLAGGRTARDPDAHAALPDYSDDDEFDDESEGCGGSPATGGGAESRPPLSSGRTVDADKMMTETSSGDDSSLPAKKRAAAAAASDEQQQASGGDVSQPSAKKSKDEGESEKKRHEAGVVPQYDGAGDEEIDEWDETKSYKAIKEKFERQCAEGKVVPEGYKLVDGYIYPVELIYTYGGAERRLDKSKGYKFGQGPSSGPSSPKDSPPASQAFQDDERDKAEPGARDYDDGSEPCVRDDAAESGVRDDTAESGIRNDNE